MTNPFPYSDTNRRFYTYDYFLRQKFGRKCFKVPLDGNFTCPNADGTKGRGGCTYCNLHLAKYRSAPLPLALQFNTARQALHQKWSDACYIAYFQNHTNTYAPVARLRELYETALSFPDVVGINISTRADCLPGDVVALLREIDRKTFLTVELGLQSIHEITAQKINRCHSYAEFVEGYEKLRGLNVCIHIINGLPGENKEMMLGTAKELALLHPQSVKIHLLHILRGTALAHQYECEQEKEKFEILTLGEYTDITVSQLEILPPDTVIARITGDGLADELIAPLWSRKKFVCMNEIDKEFVKRNSYQGIRYSAQK